MPEKACQALQIFTDLLNKGQVLRCVPSRPQTSPFFAHVDALRPGVDYYEQGFRRFLQRSSKREQIDLAAWFQHVKRGRVQVATACSGTDVPLLVYHGLLKE